MWDVRNRLFQVEERIGQFIRDLQDLLNRLVRLEQNPWLQQGPASGGSSGTSVYVCVPGTAIAAATGAPGSGSPSSITNQTVYLISGGSYSTVSTTATIYNAYLGSVVSGKVCTLGPNGDGTYTVLGQSCT